MNGYSAQSGQDIIYKDHSTSAVGMLVQSSSAPTRFDSIVIPVIHTTLPSISVGARIVGLHQGQIWTSEDFDEPLPEDFWLGSE